MSKSMFEVYLNEVTDENLRAKLKAEFERTTKKFGLVFERHSPEGIRMPQLKVRRGHTAIRETDGAFFKVHAINGESVTLKDEHGNTAEEKLTNVTAAKQFGEAVFPGLKTVGSIHSGAAAGPTHAVINGENFHALEMLDYTHHESVDLIYIDPPYNTGNKTWQYNDHYVAEQDSFRHSKWLSFMEKRLRLAKNILNPSGVILVSIDDKEQARLRVLMDEIFGSQNFLAQFVWQTDGNFDNQAKIKSNHEYVIAFAKRFDDVQIESVIDPNIGENSKLFNPEIRNTVVKNGSKNPFSSILLPSGFPAAIEEAQIPAKTSSFPRTSETMHISGGTLTKAIEVTSGWANAGMLRKFINNGFQPVIDTKGQETIFEITATGGIDNVKQRSSSNSHILTVLQNMGSAQGSGKKLEKMGLKFPYPKPVELISYLIKIASKNATILDFFGGSGTTAEAVIRLNAEDQGTRQCILVTNNELSAKDDAALRKAGHAPGSPEYEAKGVFHHVTKPRIETIVTGLRQDGSTYSDGLAANVEFLELAYLDEGPVHAGLEYERLAPLFWLKSGAIGPIVRPLNDTDAYAWNKNSSMAVLFDAGKASELAEILSTEQNSVTHVFIITDSPEQGDLAGEAFNENITVEPIYGSYLDAFQINRSDS